MKDIKKAPGGFQMLAEYKCIALLRMSFATIKLLVIIYLHLVEEFFMLTHRQVCTT
jgi:hypothetical protein